MAGMTREKAGRRLDSIAGFREEQRKLEAMGLLSLSAKEKQAIKAYHDDVLADLSDDGVRDAEPADPAHWGMRLAAGCGLLVLLGLGFAGIDHLWADLGLFSRTAVLIGLPLSAIGLTGLARFRGDRAYFVTFFSLLSVLVFALSLYGLGWLFNRPPGLEVALFPALLGTALGYHYDQKVPVFVGLAFLIFAIFASVAQFDGSALPVLLLRLDVLFGIGLFVFCLGAFSQALLAPHVAMWRAAGLLAMGSALFGLSYMGAGFLSPVVDDAHVIYQGVGLLISFAVFILGMLARWRESLYGGLAMALLVMTGSILAHFGAAVSPAMKVLMTLGLIALAISAFVGLWRFEQRRLGRSYV